MSTRALSLLTYRSIIRFARANANDVPLSLRQRDVLEVLPEAQSLNLWGSQWDLSDTKHLTRQGYRSNKHLEGEEASEALERGLKGLRLLNTYYFTQLRELRSLHQLHLNREGVEFSVGHVFVHRKHGYRGVIYGWDPKCEREADWAAHLDVNPDQPFYKVLPDEDDCQRLFGSIRITKYVAQENIMTMQVPRRVTHRALENYFTGFSQSKMRYIPTQILQYEYPDDYDAPDAVSCREDTNILRLDDSNDSIQLARFEKRGTLKQDSVWWK